MKCSKLFLITLLLCFTTAMYAQGMTDSWSGWDWLIGNWIGEGEGQPGRGEGKFSFQLDLDKHVLVRKATSNYPATDIKPAIKHSDLMIVYLSKTDVPDKAIYFDNENHVINYTVQMTAKSIVFLSEQTADLPVLRLSYTLIKPGKIAVKFEMSRDGITFKTYVEGNSIKLNSLL